MRVSEPVPDANEQDVEESVQKLIDFWPSGRKVLDIQDWLWLLLWHRPSYDTGTESKANSEEGLVPHKNIFREMKKQNPRQKLQYSHKVTPRTPASPASHLLSSSSLLHHPWDHKTNPSSCSSAYLMWRWWEWTSGNDSHHLKIVNNYLAIQLIDVSVALVCEIYVKI